VSARDWRDGRCVVIRPDVPGHLDVSSLALGQTPAERAEFRARIDAACESAPEWPGRLAERPELSAGGENR
jgi:hypothetical protein